VRSSRSPPRIFVKLFARLIGVKCPRLEILRDCPWPHKTRYARASQIFRFQTHQNGGLISIKCLTDRPWSRYLQRTPCDPDSEETDTALDVFVQAVKDEFQHHLFLWQANKRISDGVFGSHAQRLPNVPHGLNDYSDYDRIAFLTALNPRTDHFRFLASRGVDANAVRRAIYGSAVYQSVMRTSIRDQDHNRSGFECRTISGKDISWFTGGKAEKPV
jgi:hypothetical protein